MLKKIFKIVLLFLPIIYSLIRIKTDIKFYLIFISIYFIFSLLYFYKKNKNYYSYLSQLGISYIFLDLIFHNIDLKLFINAFKLIDLRIMVYIPFTMMLMLFIRAYKWKYLLSHIKPVRISSLFKTVVLGFMVNSILPARAGEFYRAYYLNKIEKINKSTIFSTIVLERIFDGLMVGLSILYVFLFRVIKKDIFYKVGLLGLGLYIMAIAMMIIFYFKKDFILTVIKYIFFFLPKTLLNKVLSLFDQFYEGLHVFKDFKNLFLFTFYTLLTWLVILLSNYLFLKSMNIFEIFPLGMSAFDFTVLMISILIFGVSVPSGPGSMGPLQASIFFTFMLVNPDFVKVGTNQYNVVASFSMYMWLYQILIVVIAGLYVHTREHLKFRVEK